MAVDVEAASFTRHVQGAADAERQSRRLLPCVGVDGFSAVVTETKGDAEDLHYFARLIVHGFRKSMLGPRTDRAIRTPPDNKPRRVALGSSS